MGKKTVLYICHNHPSVRPGGAETYALELHEAMRRSSRYEPVLLAKGGPPLSATGRVHEGTLLGMVNGDPGQYFFFTDGADYDWFYGTMRTKDVLTRFLREFLQACRPDVVHFQHTLFFGYDVIREVRNALPGAMIVYTLHEFLPICHHNGQMVRTADWRPCLSATPRRCHECFPQQSPQSFFMRKKFVQSHFELVDVFLAPSRFLMDRFIDWGIPREKIRFEEYGRLPAERAKCATARPRRDRFAFFGQANPFKGLDVLLEAMRLLGDERMDRPVFGGTDDAGAAEPHLSVFGANLDLQNGTFQNRIKSLMEQTRRNVTFMGQYDHAKLPALMADIDWVIVPSIWWENSPLVIQEAFAHGRPVICSDIGGMAEKVADGVNGLHFRAGDPVSLAGTIQRAAGEPGLWDRLAGAVPAVYPMDQHRAAMERLYEQLLERGEKRA